LTSGRPYPEAALPAPVTGDAFETVCIDERDAILAHTIREEAARDIKPGPVVAVMGSDHVLGVEKRWNETGMSGESSGAAAVGALLKFPAAAQDDTGVRLAIMQRLLGLRCTAGASFQSSACRFNLSRFCHWNHPTYLSKSAYAELKSGRV